MNSYVSPASWYRFDDLRGWLFEEEEEGSTAFYNPECAGDLRISAVKIDAPLSATAELEHYLDDEGLPKTNIETRLTDDGTEIATADLPTNPELRGKVWFISKGLFLLFVTYYFEGEPSAAEMAELDSLLDSIKIGDT